MDNQVIQSMEDFEKVFATHSEFFLLKHSLTCPISAAANKEFEHFSQNTSVPCYTIYVQEARSLSNYIAEEFGVRHESPQALLFKDGKVNGHASHGEITAELLKAI